MSDQRYLATQANQGLGQFTTDGTSADEGDSRYQKVNKLTHKELAARIGSSREAVSKCMKVLAAKGIIKEVEGSTSVARNAIELLRESGRK